jgi:hypothetical protein
LLLLLQLTKAQADLSKNRRTCQRYAVNSAQRRLLMMESDGCYRWTATPSTFFSLPLSLSLLLLLIYRISFHFYNNKIPIQKHVIQKLETECQRQSWTCISEPATYNPSTRFLSSLSPTSILG